MMDRFDGIRAYLPLANPRSRGHRNKPNEMMNLLHHTASHASNAGIRVQRMAALLVTAALLLPAASSSAQSPSAQKALTLKPLQPGVQYERVSPENVDKCTVRDVNVEGQNGWEVVGPDGTMLRRFVDTNGDKILDLWCYYNYGIEAYRDIDSDFNRKADQYRWLGTSGTRWGIDRDEDGRIDVWKRISAEEVSYEVVAALRDKDPSRFAALLATPSELDSLGLGVAKTSELESKAEVAARDFGELAGSQSLVGPQATWLQFAAPAPGLVPEGTDGSTADLVVYENVVAMFEEDGRSGQLMVGTLIKVGDCWKMVSLPNVGSEDGALTQSGVFFNPGAAMNNDSPISDDELQSLVTSLETIDKKIAAESDKTRLAPLHAERADLVEKLITRSGNREDRETWTRQLVDTLSVAIQSGEYPGGIERLKKVSAEFGRGNAALSAYADYQAIQAEYVARQTPDADFEAVQKWYLETLAEFVDRHPETVESAQAMLQLALSKEFEDKEKEALAYYRKVRDGYKGTEAGEKAAGAVRRLESVGRRIELEGKTIDGKMLKLSQLRGRPVIVHYWATWCEPCKQDMKLLNRLQSRYKRAGLTLIGINVDARRQDAEDFLRANRLPWIQLFEEGGLESSRLSKAFGVQTLPTMMLIDKTGTVVRHNIRAAELDSEIESMLK